VGGDTNEWVDPLVQHERLWREAAEFTELRNHVGLVHIAKFGRQPGAIICHVSGCAGQGSAKTGEPAEEFRRQSDFFVKDASKMLAGNPGGVREFRDGNPAASPVHERPRGRDVDCKSVIRTKAKTLE
jgi:hypothetical protein